jgi:hypothetical protein
LAVTAVAMAATTLCGAVLMDEAAHRPAPRVTTSRSPHPALAPQAPGDQVSCVWQAVMPNALLPTTGAKTSAAGLRIRTNRGDVFVVLDRYPSCALTSIAHLSKAGAYEGAACTHPSDPGAFVLRCLPAHDLGYRFNVNSDFSDVYYEPAATRLTVVECATAPTELPGPCLVGPDGATRRPEPEQYLAGELLLPGDFKGTGAGDLLITFADSGLPPLVYERLGTVASGSDIIEAAPSPGGEPLVIHSVEVVALASPRA